MGKQGLFGLNGKESPTPPPNIHPNIIWQVRLSKSSFRYVGIDPLQPLFLLFFFFFFFEKTTNTHWRIMYGYWDANHVVLFSSFY